MEKTIGLELRNFDPIPHSLRHAPALNVPCREVVVNLASLYHHYYTGSYGRFPPNPDPAHFEHLDLLLADREFRVRGAGLGDSKEIRRNRSNELGHAFCRWFLHDHADIIYFAHMEKVLGRSVHPGFAGVTIERVPGGDTPDYFCAKDCNRIFLAEAKGRHSKISFASNDFSNWRDQFSRVTVRENGRARSMKGYIVASQFATEEKPRMKSVLYAEDPATLGEEPLSPEVAGNLGRRVLSVHYSRIAEKLNQPVLAAALADGYVLPEEYRIVAFVWAFQVGPLEGRRFVGGYYPGRDGVVPLGTDDGKIIFQSSNPFRLDVGRGTFFGVDEKIFTQVAALARSSTAGSVQISAFEEIEHFYSAVSLLRDGSVIAPLEFFAPVGQTNL